MKIFIVLTIAISLVSALANSSKAASQAINNADVLDSIPGQESLNQSTQEIVPILRDMPPKDEDHLPGGSR
ncbi:MAG: hypothetical protein HC934_12700 [Acaryochloridaceae cyanobacterium SU_2_1]|nr:hypothetical protein [Acaryochloridaceae cyanobacterium SU_2_1]